MYNFEFTEDMMHDVIITFDNESQSDDPFALAYALLSPRLNIKGIIAGHYREEENYDSCRKEAEKIIRMIPGQNPPIYEGSLDTFDYTAEECSLSDGAARIIECASRKPITILCMTTLTDIALAIKAAPDIIPNLRIIWAGGGAYPLGADYEPNIMHDRDAANYVIQAGCNFWQVPKNIYRKFNISFAELQLKVQPQGELGAYLYQLIMNRAYNPKRPLRYGCYWVLGNLSIVGLMLCEHVFGYKEIPAPLFSKHCVYVNAGTTKTIRVFEDIDTRFIFEDFFAKLTLNTIQQDFLVTVRPGC